MNTHNHTPAPQPSVVGPWIWVALSAIYFVSPIDFVPDIPIIGHIDDFLIASVSTLNLIQAYLAQSNQALATIVRLLKILVILFAVVFITLVVLLGAVVVKAFFS